MSDGKEAKFVLLDEFAWERNLEKLHIGAFGDASSPKALLEYWKAQELAGYPYAEENVRYFEEMVRKESGNV